MNIKRIKASLRDSFVIAVLFCVPSSAMADDYKLGPQDKIRLSVYEWRASVSEVFQWEALTGEFTISYSGTLSLPLVGIVKASDLSEAELGAVISKKMQDVIGLANGPTVAVEIVRYRPFYIIGSVDKAGEFPFRPGLTVLQAVGIAGGMQKVTDLGLVRLGREIITQSGDIQQLETTLDAARVRKARYEAEVNGAASLVFPDDIQKRANEPGLTLVISQETAIWQARRTALRTEIESLTALKAFLAKEIESVEAQIVTQAKDLSLVQKELANVSVLVEKGLAATPRQTVMERTVAQLDGDRLRLQTELLRARQELSKTEILILEARNKQVTEVAASLRETTAKIEEIQGKISTSRKLLYEAEVSAPRAMRTRRKNLSIEPTYTIVRFSNGTRSEIAATEATLLQPADTLKVDVNIPDDVDEIKY